MNRRLLRLAVAATAASLLLSWSTAAQEAPPAKPAPGVKITEGPELESTRQKLVIIRWTSDNPGGDDEHFGVVRYGTDPNNLSETAKSHIRLNAGHSYTVFRVRLDALKPGTTYYYTVGAMGANGKVDNMKSPVKQFSTPSEPQQP